ncbi:MAG: DUF4230 domain-containing protein [Eubacteriaceae bacterium]|nr:DUF4230 domain-containing protein [Eubacteriaceae bacterium]
MGKSVRRVVRVLILLAVVALVCFYLGTRYEGPIRIGPASITSETVMAVFDDTKILVTETYNYTAMGSFTNSLMFRDWTIPLTGKSFIVSYSGTIQAGIDLGKVKVTTDGYTIYIKLPASKIISHEIDEGSVQVLDEKTNLFNPIKVEDVTGFESEQKELNEKRALEDGLLERADESAQKAVLELLSKIEGIKNYDIIFQ